MDWIFITDTILVAAMSAMTFFGLLGLAQWVRRKSFMKIDRELRFALVPTFLMIATYFIFDRFLIWNTRPNGSGEPSFPSSHVMLVATVFALVAMIIPKYIKTRSTRLTLDVIMLILTILVAVGRVLANMHWVSDVLGALVFAAIFALIYYLTIRRKPNAKRA